MHPAAQGLELLDGIEPLIARKVLDPRLELVDLCADAVELLPLRRRDIQRIEPQSHSQQARPAAFEDIEGLDRHILPDRGIGGTGEQLATLADHTFSLGSVEPPGKQQV